MTITSDRQHLKQQPIKQDSAVAEHAVSRASKTCLTPGELPTVICPPSLARAAFQAGELSYSAELFATTAIETAIPVLFEDLRHGFSWSYEALGDALSVIGGCLENVNPRGFAAANVLLKGISRLTYPGSIERAWQDFRDQLTATIACCPDLEPWFALGAECGRCLAQESFDATATEERIAQLLRGANRTLKRGTEIRDIPLGNPNTPVACQRSTFRDNSEVDVACLPEVSTREPHHVTLSKLWLNQFVKRVDVQLSAFAELEQQSLAFLNDERDVWLYRERLTGKPLKQLVVDLRNSPNFEPIDSAQGIHAAIERYAKRKGLPLPPSRRKSNKKAKRKK